MENTTLADPVQYPKLSIGGELVEVKFRCGDIIRLKKGGLDITDSEALKKMDFAQKIERMMTMLSAAISHHMTKSADELADMFDLAQLSQVDAALGEAIKKAIPQTPAAELKPNGAIQ